MKKNQVVAGLIGALLLTGSTLSISAASTAQDSNDLKPETGEVNSDYLYDLTQGDALVAPQSIPDPQTGQPLSLPVALDTVTAAIGQDGPGAAINDDADDDFEDENDDFEDENEDSLDNSDD